MTLPRISSEDLPAVPLCVVLLHSEALYSSDQYVTPQPRPTQPLPLLACLSITLISLLPKIPLRHELYEVSTYPSDHSSCSSFRTTKILYHRKAHIHGNLIFCCFSPTVSNLEQAAESAKAQRLQQSLILYSRADKNHEPRSINRRPRSFSEKGLMWASKFHDCVIAVALGASYPAFQRSGCWGNKSLNFGESKTDAEVTRSH